MYARVEKPSDFQSDAIGCSSQRSAIDANLRHGLANHAIVNNQGEPRSYDP